MSYTIKVKGESDSDFRGARPNEIDDLLKKPSKDVKTLIHQAVKAQVELAVQAGDTTAAWEAIRKYEDAEFSYKAPLNIFQRDNQNGGCPYIGGHSVFGGFRDAAKWLFPEYFYDRAPGKTKRPSATHLRKFVIVRPNHIFMYKGKDKITNVDGVEGQQPSPTVKGFARYEVVHHPINFEFSLSINDHGPFEKMLKDKKAVKEIVYQAANHGLGACRSAGYGQWEVTGYEVC